MDDLVRMSPEDFDGLSQQMRLANTARLKALLDQLEPYCDGSLGASGVSPAHVAAYIKVVRELGLLWRAYDRPVEVEAVKGVDEEAMVLEARRAAVEADLGRLRQVGMKNSGRRGGQVS
jgi:hypothetical protein